ncbi:MAG: hypothetical protein R3F43_05245 [bacterium]
MRFIQDPQAVDPHSAMPKMPVFGDDAERIADFLLAGELPAPTGAAAAAPEVPLLDRPVTYDEIHDKVLGRICVHCHMHPEQQRRRRRGQHGRAGLRGREAGSGDLRGREAGPRPGRQARGCAGPRGPGPAAAAAGRPAAAPRGGRPGLPPPAPGRRAPRAADQRRPAGHALGLPPAGRAALAGEDLDRPGRPGR